MPLLPLNGRAPCSVAASWGVPCVKPPGVRDAGQLGVCRSAIIMRQSSVWVSNMYLSELPAQKRMSGPGPHRRVWAGYVHRPCTCDTTHQQKAFT